MLATSCYTSEELERYLHGRADDELSSAIEFHLGSCARCEDTLAELDASDDTLIRGLKLKPSEPPAPAPAWIDQLVSMPHSTGHHASKLGQLAPAGDSDRLGDYELEQVLGRGGMSVVFAARHQHLGREVALKLLLPTTQQNTVSRERFSREMRAVGGLDHGAIVRATDAGEWNDTLYLVMERIDGIDLNRIARIEGPLPVADVCALGIDVARGLTHAHDQGIVHRDIKPSNLMLDRKGNVKILDFGLARVQSPSCDVSLQTTIGQLLGTLDYMAPEQASGIEVDARADIYALGATLFKLLAGGPPHGRSADMPIVEYLNRLATNEAARLDEYRDHLPAELVELIGAMLQRDPARRIETAQEVAERLLPFAVDAKLQDLAAKAMEKSDVSSGEPDLPNRASLNEFLPQISPNASSQEVPLPTTDATQPRRIGPVGWAGLATGALSLSGLVVLTIVLTLKSLEGEIRIESELDNVSVEVVDEKDRVETITVDQGGAITTLRSGRYRVRLNSPSDGIEVSPQVVTVKRNQVVIARVRKISTPKSDTETEISERDWFTAMEAQLQLAETVAELADARNKPQPNEEQIQQLEKRLTRLRALNRPVPIEPVYEGRTLADWVAQMKFEQKAEARKVAAQNVLKLAGTRRADEQMELILEAGSRLFAWQGWSLDRRLEQELDSTSSATNLTESAKLVLPLRRNVVSSHLDRALRSGNPDKRDYAVLLCADLRNETRQGHRSDLLRSLEAQARTQAGMKRALMQLTLAACVPKASRAAQLLMEIDVEVLSDSTLLAIFHVAHERKLDISRNRQVAWAAAYFSNVPHSHLDLIWQRLLIGPFANVDFDRLEAPRQAEINTMVGSLLKSFDERLERVGDNPYDGQRQQEAAVKSSILTQVVERTNLTGEAADQATTLLSRRLEQLIQYRAKSVSEPDHFMDTPARVAVAILLLNGTVPNSLMQPSANESGYLAQRMDDARTTLLPRNGAITMRGDFGGFSRGGPRGPNIAEWYPFEMLALLHDVTIRLQTSSRAASRSGRSARSSQLSQLLRSQPSWQVDPRLMIAYAMSSKIQSRNESVSAADFIGSFDSRASQSTRNSRIHLIRHPRFAESVRNWMEQVQDQRAAEFAYKLWSTVWSKEEAEAKLRDWLESGDAAQTRAAMQILATRERDLFKNEWAAEIAKAIDRIAENNQLNSRDMVFLAELGGNAHRPAQHAIDYLLFWSDNPSERARQADIVGLGRGASALRPCVDILQRFPDQVGQILEKVERAIDDAGEPVEDVDQIELQRLWESLPTD